MPIRLLSNFVLWVFAITPIETFFPRGAYNHPHNPTPFFVRTPAEYSVDTPNWFYYWSQTNAKYGEPAYRTYHPQWPHLNMGYADWEAAMSAWKAFLCVNAASSTAGGTWNDARGIDLYAHVSRHEERHRLDLAGFWPNGWIFGQDQDEGTGDWLPDTLEPTLIPQHAYNPNMVATFPDAFQYYPLNQNGQPPMLQDIDDYCLRRQTPWDNGSANLVDWASPGMQHRTLGNPDD